MAELMLRQDARTEKCPACEEASFEAFGRETGKSKRVVQYDDTDEPLTDTEGNVLELKFPEYKCNKNHTWYKGEGKAKGYKGKDQILLEEHMIPRRRREIMCQSGVPDPEIVTGIYNRSHPQGRKTNTKEEMSRRGLGFFR